MNPREVIKRNLEFSGPERFGMEFDGGRMNDLCSVGISPSDAWQPKKWNEGNFEYYDDEWGNIWYRVKGKSSGGEIYRPVLDNWEKLKEFKMPGLSDSRRFIEAKERFKNDSEHFHLGSLPGFPFAVCRYLRKMENYLQDLILERDHIEELHDRVTVLLEEIIKRWAETGADGVFFCEDWGTQERLLISPAMWREIYKPLFRRLCSTAHNSGLAVIMHSCGYNWTILDDLAETGVNCFQFDQPRLYGLERLARKLQDLKVCLFAPVDIQRILPSGNRGLIVKEAQAMVNLFFGKNGGFIAKNYGDLQGIGVLEEWDKWAYETFLELRLQEKHSL